MNLSINPWYFCNFRCDFCYLTEEQLSDKKLLPLDVLEQRLIEVISHTKVDMVDLYGGEVALLPSEYINELKHLLHNYGIDDINIITNLSVINETILDEDFYISVSYDFEAREKHKLVLRNMCLLEKPFSVLMLASPSLLKLDVNEMIDTFNLIPNIASVEIKPYSTNQANQLDIKYTEYEDFVKKWINHPKRNFSLSNETQLKAVIDKTKNSFSDDHIYITPSGNYGVLEFDVNDNEYFQEYDSLEQYYSWTAREKSKTSGNKYCGSCDYYGGCLSEHLRDVKSLDNSCNGFYNLINWYKVQTSFKV
jgi:sulfatase maturation enzyme AslB (radical SAM superfamily)